jgi:hypothetical protein
VATTTAACSRSRLEACKVFKRLAKLAGLEDTDRLDAFRTPYEPGQREIPSESKLCELLHTWTRRTSTAGAPGHW